MKILLFTSTHNGLCQRAYAELVERGHSVAIQAAQSDAAMEAAAAYFQPQLIIAPFLNKAVPASILEKYTVIMMRPDIRVNRGSFSRKGTISDNCQNWRVTVLDSTSEKDTAAMNWCSYSLKMQLDNKTSFFQHHVAQAAVQDILKAVEKLELKNLIPSSLYSKTALQKGRLHSMLQ